jgi:hypothetical protein
LPSLVLLDIKLMPDVAPDEAAVTGSTSEKMELSMKLELLTGDSGVRIDWLESRLSKYTY